MTSKKNTWLRIAHLLTLLGLLPATAALAVQTETVTLANGEVISLTRPDVRPPIVSANSVDPTRSDNLIQRLRSGFMLTPTSHPRLTQGRQWLKGKQEYVDRLLSRASRYLYVSVTEAERRHLPTELALLPVIESSYDPMALSRSQAAGLWQFIPDTGRLYGLRQNFYYDARRDPTESTQAAYDYLARLYDTFQDWHLVLAAYNAGPGTVSRAIKRNAALGLPTDYWSLNLPAETMSYVPRFLAVVEMFRDPDSYGVALNSIPNQPVYRTINTDGPMTLADIATITGIEKQVLRDLNPGLRRDLIDPTGPHQVHVPAGLDALVESQLNPRTGPVMIAASESPILAPDASKIVPVVADASQTIRAASRSTSYRVRQGDTWFSIARQLQVPVADLLAANGSNRADNLAAGRDLHLPTAAASSAPQVTDASTEVIQVVASTSADHRVEVKRRIIDGDTLTSISRQYQVTLAELRAWNGDLQTLSPGQILTLRVLPSLLGGKSL